MSNVILYDYWRSSASYRVRIALNLAGIQYDTVVVDLLKMEHKAPDHLIHNPQGLVPAIKIDKQIFTQSLAIIEYLNETRNLKLLPDTAAGRAEVRALAYAIAMDIHPVCNLGVVTHVMKLTNGDEIMRKAWMQKFIGDGLMAVELMLQKNLGALCYGDNPSLADICLVPQLYNAKRWEVNTSAFSRIEAVIANLQNNMAFADAHPDKHKA